jgi:hypothetical protein
MADGFLGAEHGRCSEVGTVDLQCLAVMWYYYVVCKVMIVAMEGDEI